MAGFDSTRVIGFDDMETGLAKTRALGTLG
jgi:hypothetical protein